jgi:hypothetical protein
MTNAPRGFTVRLTPGAGPEPIRLYCRHCKQTLAETFNNPTLTELTTSAHSHRKACP